VSTIPTECAACTQRCPDPVGCRLREQVLLLQSAMRRLDQLMAECREQQRSPTYRDLVEVKGASPS
jgi:hypothetical protein